MRTDSLISIIDDDESLRQALVSLIHSFGLPVRGFGSAEEFLGSGEMERFACIISDIQMPGMSGIDLKRHLNAQNVRTPVIMITAHTEPGLRERALATGAFGFLKKPFDANALIGCVEQALEQPAQ